MNETKPNDNAKRFETRPFLCAASALVRELLADRDDEIEIRSSVVDGTASLRIAFDSREGLISVGLAKPDGTVKTLDAVFADGREFASRRVVDVLFELQAARASH